ncbi:uncharacterized protein LOC143185923 [Calliopsis andreniformis]|uniref:uncharacterized protein LOC143185923 n=1 Tax=Calliopsis andreniformis TaxID=337506 RepID=UPI003FCCB4C5
MNALDVRNTLFGTRPANSLDASTLRTQCQGRFTRLNRINTFEPPVSLVLLFLNRPFRVHARPDGPRLMDEKSNGTASRSGRTGARQSSRRGWGHATLGKPARRRSSLLKCSECISTSNCFVNDGGGEDKTVIDANRRNLSNNEVSTTLNSNHRNYEKKQFPARTVPVV